MKYKWLILLVLLIVSLIVAWFVLFAPSENPEKTKALDSFAKCLAQKKITMYGAEWCSHCKNEKKAFGSSFQYVPYVECPKNTKVCLDKKVRGYPTWIFPDGKKLEGEQGLATLAKESKCALPDEFSQNQ